MKIIKKAVWLLKFIYLDWRLGRLIRSQGLSVMRINEEHAGPEEWSVCDSMMEFDFGHCGKWGNGKTPLDAIRKLRK
jgi:hypothetical protein